MSLRYALTDAEFAILFVIVDRSQGSTLIKRLAMAIEDGTIVKVWYPVFPPDKNASDVVEWLKTRTGREKLSTQAENDMLRNMQKKKP